MHTLRKDAPVQTFHLLSLLRVSVIFNIGRHSSLYIISQGLDVMTLVLRATAYGSLEIITFLLQQAWRTSLVRCMRQ